MRLEMDIIFLPALLKRAGQVCVESKNRQKTNGIILLYSAYDIPMKKVILSIGLAVFFTFTSAVVLCVRALNAPQAVFGETDEKMTIVLDAGHGGIDGGVVGRRLGVKESDLNLAITLRLKDALEENGFLVVLTRKTQAGLYGLATKGFKRRDMERRRQIIEENDPALVLSIHQNFYASHSTRGGQVFYKKGDEQGAQFALCVQKQLNDLYKVQGAKSRTTMTGEFFMLNCTPSPSLIVECGFLSNADDEKLLVDGVWREQLVHSIAAGVTAYLAQLSL